MSVYNLKYSHSHNCLHPSPETVPVVYNALKLLHMA